MELNIHSLFKTYPNGVRAIKNISLTLREGMFGLLGPNGAGKSTLMRTIATLQEPDKGSIFLDEINVLNQHNKLRQVLGYLPQEFGVYPRITAEQMLDHVARLKGVSDRGQRGKMVSLLLDRVNLTKEKGKRLGTFSGGMKQRFGIAQALIGNPKLIIVDEPTAGLDPAERNRFYNLLSLIGENTIVILSTHIVEDVSTLCNQFAIIHEGEVLYCGSPESAIRDLDGKIFQKLISKIEIEYYKKRYPLISTQLKGGSLYIRIFSDTVPQEDFSATAPDLEDVYFRTIGTSVGVNII